MKSADTEDTKDTGILTHDWALPFAQVLKNGSPDIINVCTTCGLCIIFDSNGWRVNHVTINPSTLDYLNYIIPSCAEYRMRQALG